MSTLSKERKGIVALSKMPEDITRKIIEVIIFKSADAKTADELKKEMDKEIENCSQNNRLIREILTKDRRKSVINLITTVNKYNTSVKKLPIKDLKLASLKELKSIEEQEVDFIFNSTVNFDIDITRNVFNLIKQNDTFIPFIVSFKKEYESLLNMLDECSKIRGSRILSLSLKVRDEMKNNPENVVSIWNRSTRRFSDDETRELIETFRNTGESYLEKFDDTVTGELITNREKENPELMASVLKILNEKFKVYNNIIKVEAPIIGSFLEKIKISNHPAEEIFDDALKEFKNASDSILKEKLVSYQKFQPAFMEIIVNRFDEAMAKERTKGSNDTIEKDFERIPSDLIAQWREGQPDTQDNGNKKDNDNKKKNSRDNDSDSDDENDNDDNAANDTKFKFTRTKFEAISKLPEEMLRIIVEIFNTKVDANNGFAAIWSDTMSDFVALTNRLNNNEFAILGDFCNYEVESLRPALEKNPADFKKELESFTRSISLFFSQIYIINDYALALIVNYVCNQPENVRKPREDKGYANSCKKRWTTACEDFISFVKSDLSDIYKDLEVCDDDMITWFLNKYEEDNTNLAFDYRQYASSKGQAFTEKDHLFRLVKLREGPNKEARNAKHSIAFSHIIGLLLKKYFSEEIAKIDDRRKRWSTSLKEANKELFDASQWVKKIKATNSFVASIVLERLEKEGSKLGLNQVVETSLNDLMDKYAKIHSLSQNVINLFSKCLNTKKHISNLSWKHAVQKLRDDFSNAASITNSIKDVSEAISQKIYEFLKLFFTGKHPFDLSMQEFIRDIDANTEAFNKLGENNAVFLGKYIVHESIKHETVINRWRIAVDWFANSTSVINAKAYDNFSKFDNSAKRYVVDYVSKHKSDKASTFITTFKPEFTIYINDSASKYAQLFEASEKVVNELKNRLGNANKWKEIFSRSASIPKIKELPECKDEEEDKVIVRRVISFLNESFHQLSCCFDQFAFNCDGPIFQKVDISLLRMLVVEANAIYREKIGSNNPIKNYWDEIIQNYQKAIDLNIENLRQAMEKDSKKASTQDGFISDSDIISLFDALMNQDYKDAIQTLISTSKEASSFKSYEVAKFFSLKDRNFVDFIIQRLMILSELLKKNLKTLGSLMLNPIGENGEDANTKDSKDISNGEKLYSIEKEYKSHYFDKKEPQSSAKSSEKSLTLNDDYEDENVRNDSYKLNPEQLNSIKILSFKIVYQSILIRKEFDSNIYTGLLSLDSNDYCQDSKNVTVKLDKAQDTANITTKVQMKYLLTRGRIISQEYELQKEKELAQMEEIEKTAKQTKKTLKKKKALQGEDDIKSSSERVQELEVAVKKLNELRNKENKKRREILDSYTATLKKEVEEMRNQLDTRTILYQNVSEEQKLRFIRPKITPEQLRFFENVSSNFAPVKNPKKKLSSKWSKYIVPFILKTNAKSSDSAHRLIISTKTHVKTSNDYTTMLEKKKQKELKKKQEEKKKRAEELNRLREMGNEKEYQDRMRQFQEEDNNAKTLNMLNQMNDESKYYEVSKKMKEFDIALIQRFVKIYQDSCAVFFTKVNDFKKMLENFHSSFAQMGIKKEGANSKTKEKKDDPKSVIRVKKERYELIREIIEKEQSPLDKSVWEKIMEDFKKMAKHDVNLMIDDINRLDDTTFCTFINHIVSVLEKKCDTPADFDSNLDEVVSDFEEYERKFSEMTVKTKEIKGDTWGKIKEMTNSACTESTFASTIITTTIKDKYKIDQLLEDKSIILNLSEFQITEATAHKETTDKPKDPTPTEKEIFKREEAKEREELRNILIHFSRNKNDYNKTIYQVYFTNASKLIETHEKNEATGKDDVKYTLGNWLMQSHIDYRIIEGFKRAVTILVPDNSWQRLLQEALLSNVVRLDDIIPYIPRKMELEFLNHQIIKSVSSYQSTNKSAEAVITELKSRFTEQQKKLETKNENEIEIDPSCYCEFCKEPIYQGRFIVFPCHHAVHVKCFLENMSLYFSPADQLNLIALQSSALRKSKDRDDLIEQLSRSCPMCGEISVNALDKKFTIEDPSEEKQWSLI